VEVDETAKLEYSLPPRPPEGVFDIRFIGGTRICGDECEIELISPFEELTIKYNVIYNVNESMGWMITLDNGKNYFLEGNGSLTIPSAKRIFLNREPVIPVSYLLYQNFPNPFNPITTIRYDLPEGGMVKLTIYDIKGRKMNELINANKAAGYGSVEWDATDSYGNVMSAGVYIFQLRVANLLEGQATVRTRKMVLLK
jgi:hypothetical protein